jgi:glutathione S-transferase
MQGQAVFFNRFSPEKIPYAQKRYTDETKRLFGVLEIRLAGGKRDWLAGSGKGKYSIVDANTWPWVRGHAFSGVCDTLDEWPAVKAWTERIADREPAQAGTKVPA